MQDQERNALVEAHVHLIRPVVARISRKLPKSFGFDDLVQAGALGLIAAASSFDARRGVPFGVYARLKIRGAVLDAIAPDVRSGIRTKQLEDLPAVAATLRATRGVRPDLAVLSNQLSGIVAMAVERLGPQQRRVMLLRYQANLTQSDAGAVLGITGARVSQIEKEALRTLRQNLRVPLGRD